MSDGYRWIVEVALPWLRHFGYPGVVFVPTAFIGGRNAFDDGAEPPEAICSWGELAELERNGLRVQSHGVTHRPFSELDPAGRADELRQSKAALETRLGTSVTLFAYPFGVTGPDREGGGSGPAAGRLPRRMSVRGRARPRPAHARTGTAFPASRWDPIRTCRPPWDETASGRSPPGIGSAVALGAHGLEIPDVMRDKYRIAVAGYMVRFPIGGYAWQAAHYLLGFKALGHDVWFYEETEYFDEAYNPETQESGPEYAYGLAAASRFLASIGFDAHWTFVDSERGVRVWPRRRSRVRADA